VREVREELGVHLSGVRPAFTVHAPAHGLPEGTRLTMHCFYADPTGEPSPAGEIAEIAWLDRTDPHRAAPAVRRVIATLAADPDR
jgi:ADP-ribose pyrophosphatase YjhB (NUDIX family)